MSDDRFDSLWPRSGEDYHRPPDEVPADEMWQRIQARRRRRPGWRLRPLPRRILWPAAAAAVLVLGIAIGRGTRGPSTSPVEVANTEDPASATTNVDLYQVAAADYLARTEAVLAAFRQDRRPTDRDELGPWARDLLLETRLLLESPAAKPDAMQLLLTDLEMVLAQIVQMDTGRADTDRRWIEASIEDKSILRRVRETQPAAASRGG
jgi:hypothetical protein